MSARYRTNAEDRIAIASDPFVGGGGVSATKTNAAGATSGVTSLPVVSEAGRGHTLTLAPGAGDCDRDAVAQLMSIAAHSDRGGSMIVPRVI